MSKHLKRYADKQIEAMGLGEDGPLGTEFVVAYDDVGDGRVRISDGHGEDVCGSTQEVDASLRRWLDWINEG